MSINYCLLLLPRATPRPIYFIDHYRLLSLIITTRCSTASFHVPFYIRIINQTLISLSQQAALWLCNFVLDAQLFLLQPAKQSLMLYICIYAPILQTDFDYIWHSRFHSRHVNCYQHLKRLFLFPGDLQLPDILLTGLPGVLTLSSVAATLGP